MNLYVTRSGLRLSRLFVGLLVAFVASVLLVTMLPGMSFADDPKQGKSSSEQETAVGDSDGDGVLDRPDEVSAAITARLSGRRVEVLSKKTETSQTFINADGSWTDEQYGSPVRVLDDKGEWQDVNLDLVKQADGSYRPKASPTSVTVNGGSSKEAARVTFDDGESLAVTWPDALPEPTVEGGVATYALSKSTDLLISITTTGVTARLRLNEAPQEADPVFTFGLRTEGADVTKSGSGLNLVDSDGDRLGGTSALRAWDASVDEAGDPIDPVPLDTSLQEASQSGDVTRHDLTLQAPEGFLTSPSTEYPVIIDPDISSLSTLRDTWIRSGDANNYGDEYKLISGKVNGSSNTNAARSLLQFDTAPIAGKTVLKAQLGLYQYYGYTCADKAMYVRPVTSTWTAGSTWANAPTATSTDQAGVSTNRGSTGCGPGWTTANVTAMTKAWATGVRTNYGLRLQAGDETVSSFERRFCSSNPDASNGTCYAANRRPYLSVTYNSAPKVPTGLKITPTTSTSGSLWTTASKPKVSMVLADPEKQNVKAQFEVKKGAAAVAVTDSVNVASGGTVTKEFPPLSDGTYTIRARAFDGELPSAWTAATTLKVDTTPPPAPAVTCTDATSGAWYETRPAGLSSTTCTVAGGSDVVGFDWTRGNKPQPGLVANSGNATLGTFVIPANGVFGVSVRARDAAGNQSLPAKFGFGIGKGGTITPAEGERTSSTVTVEGEGPEGADSARIEYQPVGSDPAAWVTATKVTRLDNGLPWLPEAVEDTDHGSVSTGKLVWDISAEPGITAPAVRETRICFIYSGVDSCTSTSEAREVTVVPAAFGGSFPTQDAGPGQVALFTGEFQLSASDVEVPAYSGTLSLGRSHRSYAGDMSPAAGVFGPGWVANLSGPEAGVASMDVVDNTTTEAAITLVAPDGSSSTYVHEDGIASAQRTGVYVGDAETGTDNDILEIYTDGGNKYLALTEEDETETTWHFTDGKWLVQQVEDAADMGTTRFTHDSDGLVTGIYAPAPAGVTCTPASQTAGCRALWLTYTGAGAAKRLSHVDLRIWDPKPGADGKPGTGKGMTTVRLENYAYNGNGTLKEAWDPRLDNPDGSSLKAEYKYSTIGTKTVLTEATAPGQTTWEFSYETSGSNSGMFKTAKRAQAAPLTGEATWTVDYDTPLNGAGLPDVRQSATSTWGQDNAPVAGAAVFGPDAPDTSDPTYGMNSYWDVEGRTTNTAAYGAGDWQIDSTVYDAKGNEVWALDEGNRNTALTTDGDSKAVANSLATLTVYNEGSSGIPAGTRVEKTFGPTRDVILTNGNSITGRSMTTTVYDDEAASDPDPVPTPGRPTPDPDAPAMNLPVETRMATVDAAGNVYDITRTRMRYDPVETGDGDGWVLGTPTRTTVAYGTSVASTTMARFDSEGRILETRTPQGVAAVDGTANDARSTKTIYYSADESAADADCREKPEWAGLGCLTKTGDSTIPQTKTTGFDYLLNVTRSEESAAGGTTGSMTRASITRYHAVGRVAAKKTSVTNAPAGDPVVEETTYSYSPKSGALTSISAGAVTMISTMDAWGRVVTQTDGTGNKATSTYDEAGRVKTFNDGKGTYIYTYDGTDAAGKIERRGLVTKLKVGLPSGPDEFTTAANADGVTYLTKYPNGITATTEFDAVGAETALTYLTSSGTELAAFANTLDSQSRIVAAESTGSSQAYTYDGRDRLVKVQDTTSDVCVTRQYGFSLDSNRTTLTTSGPDANGACTAAGATTVTSAFDNADRITEPGYTYDALGRTRTVPAVHTDQPAGGALTANYHDNDMVAKLTQTVPNGAGGTVTKEKSFSLDPAARLSKTSTTSAGVELDRTTNNYADGSDSPAWINTESRPDAATGWSYAWTRNVIGPVGDLAIIQPDTGPSKIQIANIRGDIVATVDNTTTATPDSWVETTEYGLAKQATSLGQNYGWLGAKRRSTNTVGGLTLMGLRLYNPTVGRFLSRDPVPGGNDNTYIYPADPVNGYDLDGRGLKSKIKKYLKKQIKKLAKALKSGWNSKVWKKAAKGIGSFIGRRALQACGYVPGAASTLCALVGFAATWRRDGKDEALKYARDEIIGSHGAAAFAKAFKSLAGGLSSKLANRLIDMVGQLHWDALDQVMKNT